MLQAGYNVSAIPDSTIDAAEPLLLQLLRSSTCAGDAEFDAGDNGDQGIPTADGLAQMLRTAADAAAANARALEGGADVASMAGVVGAEGTGGAAVAALVDQIVAMVPDAVHDAFVMDAAAAPRAQAPAAAAAAVAPAMEEEAGGGDGADSARIWPPGLPVGAAASDGGVLCAAAGSARAQEIDDALARLATRMDELAVDEAETRMAYRVVLEHLREASRRGPAALGGGDGWEDAGGWGAGAAAVGGGGGGGGWCAGCRG